MKMNIVKDMLRAGKTAIGTTASLTSPAGLLADAGFDFLLFDTQHSAVGIKELQHQLKAMKGKKAIPIIRVGDNYQDQICYALDIGAKGIIVPMVNSKEEAIHMVRCCKYPPEGIRSAAGMRGEWGEFENFDEYMSAVNEELLIIPMVETLKALGNLDEILSVPGIDVLLVGPSDLSIASIRRHWIRLRRPVRRPGSSLACISSLEVKTPVDSWRGGSSSSPVRGVDGQPLA
jgi:4-hydroxy-2-oxoheptanedioate aldolase